MAKDLVCGMEVDEATAQWKSEYMDKTYYFCAPGCKRAFDTDPEKYLKDTDTDMGPHRDASHDTEEPGMHMSHH